MSAGSFVFVLALDAACLAAWIAVRFPGFGPQTLTWAFANLLVAYLCGKLVGPAMDAIGELPIPYPTVAAIALGALLPLVYLFLAVAWLVRAATAQLVGSR